MAHKRIRAGRRELCGLLLGLAAAACGATLEDTSGGGPDSSGAGTTLAGGGDVGPLPTSDCADSPARGLDATAPEWDDEAALDVREATDGALRLVWPDAADDGCVVRYRVTRDGVTVGFTGARVLAYELPSLAPGEAHRFCVSAADAAGNVTRRSLCAPVPTAAAP